MIKLALAQASLAHALAAALAFPHTPLPVSLKARVTDAAALVEAEAAALSEQYESLASLAPVGGLMPVGEPIAFDFPAIADSIAAKPELIAALGEAIAEKAKFTKPQLAALVEAATPAIIDLVTTYLAERDPVPPGETASPAAAA